MYEYFPIIYQKSCASGCQLIIVSLYNLSYTSTLCILCKFIPSCIFVFLHLQNGIHVIPMWCACVTHDVVYMWYQCRGYVTPTWWACDTHVVYMWYPCGVHVIAMWWACDTHVVCMWYPHGVHVIPMCWACDNHVVGMWYPCGVHVISTWCACDTHVVLFIYSLYFYVNLYQLYVCIPPVTIFLSSTKHIYWFSYRMKWTWQVLNLVVKKQE